MPESDPRNEPADVPRHRQQVRFSFKLLGAELLWNRTPAPPGIELRDFIAVHAMGGYMFHVSEDSGSPLLAKVARIAYRMADEMLRARVHPPKPPHPTGDSTGDGSGERSGIK